MPSTRRSKPADLWQVSLRGLFVLTALIAVGSAIWSSRRQALQLRRAKDELQRVQQERDQWKFQVELERVGAALKVPTEALYHNYMPRGELDRLRWEAFERFDVMSEFVPLIHLFQHEPRQPYLHHFGVDRSGNTADFRSLQDSFWEGYAINHADDGADLLVGHLKRKDGSFRRMLLLRPRIIQKYLTPLLLRLVRAPEPRARYAAIEALLLLGDRSPTIRKVLQQSLQRPGALPKGATFEDRARFYSVDPEQAQRLIREYKLKIQTPVRGTASDSSQNSEES